jgi:predicted O-linked N-acetylglucosamine transferase (SPINDLY family)
MSQLTPEQAMATATEHFRIRRFADAQAVCRSIVAVQPDYHAALHLLGLIAGNSGRREEGIALLQQAVALAPQIPGYFCNLAILLFEQGQFDQAIAAYERAIALAPIYPKATAGLGDALKAAGRLDEAVASYRQALALTPNSPEFHNNLGLALTDKGETSEAVASFRRAIALKGDNFKAYNNLGSALRQAGDTAAAIAAYRQALKINESFPEAHNNLGIALKIDGKLDEAIASYRRALALKPNYPAALSNLGCALNDKGMLNEAVACHQWALALKQNNPKAAVNLGIAWRDAGWFDEAAACLEQAVALDPTMPEAHNTLATVRQARGQIDEAITGYHKAIELRPDFAEAHNNLANALDDSGRYDEAVAEYRQAVSIDPGYSVAASNLLFAMHHQAAADRRSLWLQSIEWNRQFAQPLASAIQPHPNDRDPNRRLRIGYVSPDFRGHPVGRFILPLLAGHDHAAFEVFGYAQVAAQDELTGKIRSCADAWRTIVGLSDEQAADLIREDRIDILIDLAMHTAENRLLVFARKPAPVQATYLAYAGGAAVEAIDYRLTDRYLDPDASDDQYYLQNSIRLNSTYWCYQPPESAPPASDLPARAAGAVTFGCLNKFSKINDTVLSLWARILSEVPRSRLMLLASEGAVRRRVLDVLQRQKIDPARIEFCRRVPFADYYRAYHRMDIALDPFPYNGGTTTCDALWMGVPVITLAGQTAVGRAGVSILSNAGLPQLIAQSIDDYAKIARDLAGDLPRLADLRATLRDRLRNSPLMDAGGYVRAVEETYHGMWRAWCAAQ